MRGEAIEVRDMIDRLVGFDTTSSKSNLQLIDFVANYLASYDVKYELVYNPNRTKANLFATVGPEVSGGIVLSGHTDVVPVAGQAWDSDPFKIVERDGCLFGRGTADMKAFIGIGLALVPEMLARTLRKPIHFALSYDEEVGCLGAPLLIAEFGRRLPLPQVVIVGEPTGMKVVSAHKGTMGFETIVTGLECHSSTPHRGVSAVMYAAEIIHYLNTLAAEMREQAIVDSPFDPPYTSINVGMIEGGTALCIIARTCRFAWECRVVPGGNFEEIPRRLNSFIDSKILPRMRATSTDAGVETKSIVAVPPLTPDPDSPAVLLAQRLTGANHTLAVAYGAEAGQFQQAGISAVLCGPGDIAQAHKPNEFITLEQIDACTDFLQRLIASMAEA